MAPRRSVLVCFVSVVVLAAYTEAGNKGCGKSAVRERSHVTQDRIRMDVSKLMKGIKRSTEEDLDCSNGQEEKKSQVDIKQAAVGAIPGQNYNEQDKKSSVTTTNEHDYLMLPNHKMNVEENVLGIKRTKLSRKPLVRTMKNSPLWSLSKLIEEVDSSASPVKKNNTGEEIVKETAKEISPKSEPIFEDKMEGGVAKANVATDPSTGIKATLTKAIEKVEKVIAARNANMITPKKAVTEEGKRKNSNSSEPTNGTEKSSSSSPQISSPSTSQASAKNASAAPTPEKKKGGDPYAEIAAGPDRPKIPELKTDNGPSNDEPVTKFKDESIKQSAGAKNGKPLFGQHDIGGLLDSLTDKLNKGGGGVAMDSEPLTGSVPNEVNYVQSPMGFNENGPAVGAGDSHEKQIEAFGLDKLKDQADHNDVEKMTEQEGLLAGGSPSGQNLDSLAQEGLGGGIGDLDEHDIESKLSPPSTSTGETEGLGGSLNDAANTDAEGISKSLSKASTMTTNAIIDALKSAKIPSTDDYFNADVSPGPDPYSLNGESEQEAGTENLNSMFATKSSDSESSEQDVLNRPGSYGTQDDISSSDLDNRSTEQTADMDDEYQRNTIPFEDQQATYRDKYNTEVFKKHIIMRPKRDAYVSPFKGREEYDTAL